jgi:glyoxylase-like metal-dependent hydrolase (beta-lactamase superfamily II)
LDASDHINGDYWRLFAVEYARSHAYPRSRLVRGATGVVDMSWYFYAAVGKGHVVLIDVGTDKFKSKPGGDLWRRWQIARARDVPSALGLLGLTPPMVTDVILTHRHWDHTDGLVHYPKAIVYAHRGEWETMNLARSARLFDTSTFQPLPGIEMQRAGWHTEFHSVVRVQCKSSSVVIGGDMAYLFENLAELRSITLAFDVERNIEDMSKLQETGMVLPGHDPALFDRHASPVAGVAQVCR